MASVAHQNVASTTVIIKIADQKLGTSLYYVLMFVEAKCTA